MVNTKMAVNDKGELVITINLKERHGLSKSQKSTTVASTSGNVSVPGFPDIKIGLNAYEVVSAAK